MSMVKFTKNGGTCVDRFFATRSIEFNRNQARKLTISTAETLKMPDCKYTPPTYNGTSYEDVKKAHESSVSPSLKGFYKQPLLIHEGRGQWLWDHNGKRYLDMFGGVATVSVGHSHPKITAAISRQASKLNHVSSIYMHPRLHEYVSKLTAKFSGKLKVVYLTNSGSEANELAFLMAKMYTRKQNIISFRNGYHGGTYASSASTAISTWKYPFPQPSGYVHPLGDSWRVRRPKHEFGNEIFLLPSVFEKHQFLGRIMLY